MKSFLTTILVCLGVYLSNPALSQTITYYYDDTGNRTDRLIVFQKSATVSDTVSKAIQEKELSSKGFNVILYPNPTNGILRIDVIQDGPGEAGDLQFEVYDLSGRIILIRTASLGSNIIDFSEKTYGTYILVLRCAEVSSRWKIIKR